MTGKSLAEQFPPPDWHDCPPASAARDEPPVLYHFPDSTGCQQLRLALAEKGIRWQGQIVNLLQFAELQPEFLHKNPRAQLPLLEHGGCSVFDIPTLMAFLEARFAGPVLIPADPLHRAEMDRWLAIETRLPLRELSTALQTGWRRRLADWYLARRLTTIRRLAEKHPAQRPVYDALLADTRHWIATVQSAGEVRRSLQLCASILERMNQLLEKQSYLAGDTLSMADVVWTPVLHRMQKIGMQRLWDEARLPALAEYLQRMQQRDNFAGAVTDYERATVLARVWLPVILPRVTLAVFLLAALLISVVVLLGN